MRELSAKMPATVDSTLPARDPATREGDTQQTGDNGPANQTPESISRDTNHGSNDIEWEAIDDNKPGWEIGTDEQKGPAWEVTDRKDENDEGDSMQRPADEAGPSDQNV